MSDWRTKAASIAAINDITDYLRPFMREQFKREGRVDNYLVSACYLRSKETTRLNKELGIAGINKIGNTNGKPK
jgi:hypothetical protein